MAFGIWEATILHGQILAIGDKGFDWHKTHPIAYSNRLLEDHQRGQHDEDQCHDRMPKDHTRPLLI